MVISALFTNIHQYRNGEVNVDVQMQINTDHKCIWSFKLRS